MSAQKLICRKIGLFFAHLGERKLIVDKFLKYQFRTDFDMFHLHNFILYTLVLTSLKRKILRKPAR